MNKRKIILVIIIIIVIIIPLSVFASRNFKIALDKGISSDELKKQLNEEKKEWIKNNEYKNDDYKYVYENNKIIDEQVEKYKEVENKINDEFLKMEKIIKKFHEKEYMELSMQVNENANKMSANELYNQPYTERIFSLIIDVIKNKDITEEEKNILKKFLNEQSKYMENDSKIKKQIEEL